MNYANVTPDRESSVVELDRCLLDTSSAETLSFGQQIGISTHDCKLNLKHHSIPATSAAMERCFSAAGYIANARRSCLGDDILEGMLIAKSNKDLLYLSNLTTA